MRSGSQRVMEIMGERRDANAVIHTHSAHATTLACLRKEIPAVHYLVGLFGGNNSRCADYATFGTAELTTNLLRALQDRRAALMANHGLVVLGTDLKQVLSLTHEAETLAALYWRALCAGEPAILSPSEMELITEKFSAFGCGPVENDSGRSNRQNRAARVRACVYHPEMETDILASQFSCDRAALNLAQGLVSS